jgi:hypothetical protein
METPSSSQISSQYGASAKSTTTWNWAPPEIMNFNIKPREKWRNRLVTSNPYPIYFSHFFKRRSWLEYCMKFGSYFTENIQHIRYKVNSLSNVQDDYCYLFWERIENNKYSKTLITNKCAKRALSSVVTHSYMFRISAVRPGPRRLHASKNNAVHSQQHILTQLWSATLV